MTVVSLYESAVSVPLIGEPFRLTTHDVALLPTVQKTCTAGDPALQNVFTPASNAEGGGVVLPQLATVSVAGDDVVDPPPFVAVTV